MRYNYYNPIGLRRIGISEDTPDLRDLVIPGYPVHKAYCKSSKCAKKSASRGVEKKVKKETETCPDCGYFLFWKTTSLNRSTLSEQTPQEYSGELSESEGRDFAI